MRGFFLAHRRAPLRCAADRNDRDSGPGEDRQETLVASTSISPTQKPAIYGSIINVFNRLALFDPQAGYGFYNCNLNYAQSGATGTLFNLGAKYVWN